jgi:cysteine desulfurase/selenocysteine lyase
VLRLVEKPLEVSKIRQDFPALHQEVNGHPLVYLDNAATTQKPLPVIEAIRRFYMEDCANVHRGIHALSERATERYENAREVVRRFLNARSTREIIFVRGATEGINLVAHSYLGARAKAGDEVIISALEHHSNIVPWQILRDRIGIQIRVVPINREGKVIFEEYLKAFTPRTRLVAIAHMSNALGTILPLREMIAIAHEHGVPVLVDGAQSVPHLPVDLQELDCDFFTFSGHKIFGPTGIGVLYGKEAILDTMPPYQGGGDMIRSVTFERTIYNSLPYKFEAGTPHIAGAIGLGEALNYVERVGRERIVRYEQELIRYATEAVSHIPGLKIYGTAPEKGAILSFGIPGIHPHDLGTLLDQRGIAIRAGHHCAQPVMDFFGIPATARASFAFYNTFEEVDRLVQGIEYAIHKLSR